jgi:hypothetical protein
MKPILLAAAILAGLAFTPPGARSGQDPEREVDLDKTAIEAAIGRYVDAFYLEKPQLIEESVHSDLVKFGYSRGEGPDYAGAAMTRDQLKAIAASFKSYGDPGRDSPREIVVLDHLDKTATARLTALWGIDYMHLAKLEGRWWIVQVLWQTAPPRDSAIRAGDRAAIERAVTDYVESAYDVKPENVDRSVSRELVKLGFTKRAPDEEWKRHDMTFDGLRALVSTWNADGHIPKDAVKRIEVLGQLDKIAAAKATADWGVDYFQLEKDAEGRWRIRHVLWQSHPLPQGPAGDPTAPPETGGR